MKAKTLFITIFLALQMPPILSQCISIELSVTWKIENDFFIKDSLVSIPQLNFTYRNNCDSNYYFLKVVNNRDALPKVICAIMFYPSDEKESDCYETIKYNSKTYSNQIFNVKITGYHSYNSGLWRIFRDTIAAISTECALDGIYHCIRYDYNLENFRDYVHMLFERGQPVKYHFEPSDIVPENILGAVKDQFVFLKSGETYTDTYNLLGFQIVEGCYTFAIDQNIIESCVEAMTHSDPKLMKWTYQKIELPAHVGDYHRYSGSFNTNKVTVCFGESIERGSFKFIKKQKNTKRRKQK